MLALRETDTYIVIDDLEGQSLQNARLHWLFPDNEFNWNDATSTLNLQTPVGEFYVRYSNGNCRVSMVRAGELLIGKSELFGSETEVRGWRSLYYGEKLPALSLAVAVQQTLPIRFITVLAPAAVEIEGINEAEIILRYGSESQKLVLGRSSAERVFREML